jgi:hypothetical protein
MQVYKGCNQVYNRAQPAAGNTAARRMPPVERSSARCRPVSASLVGRYGAGRAGGG